MALAAAIVLLITGLAQIIGPAWSGYLSTYPSISLLMAVFTLKQAGPNNVTLYWRGLLSGMPGSVLFFFTLVFILTSQPAWLAFLAAAGANIAANSFVVWRMEYPLRHIRKKC